MIPCFVFPREICGSLLEEGKNLKVSIYLLQWCICCPLKKNSELAKLRRVAKFSNGKFCPPECIHISPVSHSNWLFNLHLPSGTSPIGLRTFFYSFPLWHSWLFLTNWETLIMRVSEADIKIDLDSFCNSCGVNSSYMSDCYLLFNPALIALMRYKVGLHNHILWKSTWRSKKSSEKPKEQIRFDGVVIE